jgi:omega-6 fatty acid desaturase (delta-12 desaturase)
MSATPTSIQPPPSWKQALAPYSEASNKRAAIEIATSLLPYLIIFAVTYATLGVSLPLTIALELLAAGFLVRTFVIFHDCAHGSLLPSRRANVVAGTVLGMFVLTPFRRWRHEHAVHHATSGDLDRRGVGDVMTFTVAEYHSKPWLSRLGYRMFRNPIVMFGIGPVFAMIIGPRVIGPDARPRLRNSVIFTDVVLAAAFTGLVLWMGWRDLLIVWLPPAMLAGSAGIWLFYVQHQFEDAYWQKANDWNYAEAALQGSTYLKLPKVLQFFTGNIGLHHVHHLNARIPNYNLQRAHNSHPIFTQVPTITIADGMRAVRFKLWDERSNKMVTFAQARRSRARTLTGAETMLARPERQGAS